MEGRPQRRFSWSLPRNPLAASDAANEEPPAPRDPGARTLAPFGFLFYFPIPFSNDVGELGKSLNWGRPRLSPLSPDIPVVRDIRSGDGEGIHNTTTNFIISCRLRQAFAPSMFPTPTHDFGVPTLCTNPLRFLCFTYFYFIRSEFAFFRGGGGGGGCLVFFFSLSLSSAPTPRQLRIRQERLEHFSHYLQTSPALLSRHGAQPITGPRATLFPLWKLQDVSSFWV